MAKGNGDGSVWSTGTGQSDVNDKAFAALKSDGSVVTWGAASHGGDASAVSAQLSAGVVGIYSTGSAFAALKDDGSVVTWGNATNGGGAGGASAQLSEGVETIYSTSFAFAARKADGSVVTWGSGLYGGDSSSVAAAVSGDVTEVFSNLGGFAAVKTDGSVVTWGLPPAVAGFSGVASSLTSGVEAVFSSTLAFAARKADGSVITWGSPSHGGDSSSVTGFLASGVTDLASTGRAFAALKANGSVVAWGDATFGGDASSADADLSTGVEALFSTESAFAALKSDGSVVTWGDSVNGGASGGVAGALAAGVESISSTGYAFAALKTDGSVVTWGGSNEGGDASDVAADLLSGVVEVFSNRVAFAALKADGSVVTWGNPDAGGVSADVGAALATGVVDVFANERAFAAVRSDGSVVTWGDVNAGGASDAVADDLMGGVVGLTGAGPFDAAGVDGSTPSHLLTAGLLAFGSDLAWQPDGDGQTVTGAEVTIGRTDGDDQQLRVREATITVSSTTVTVTGDVAALTDAGAVPLFSGSFTLDPLIGLASFTGNAPPVADHILGGLAEVTYGEDFEVGATATRFETDIALGAVLLQPVATAFSAAGRAVDLSDAGVPAPDGLALSFLADGDDWALTFSDLAPSYDAAGDALFLRGTAQAEPDTFLGGALGAIGMDGDLSATLENDSFIRIRAEGGSLVWDVVGQFAYSAAAPQNAVSTGLISIDTQSQSLKGLLDLRLPYLGAQVGAHATFAGDPVRIDAAEIPFAGLHVPLAGTGLALSGGTLGAQDLAQLFAAGDDWQDAVWTGIAEIRLATPEGTVPILSGSLDGAVGPQTVDASLDASITVAQVLDAQAVADWQGAAAAGQVERYLGVAPADVAEFEIWTSSGTLSAELSDTVTGVSGPVAAFGLLAGSGTIALSQTGDVLNLNGQGAGTVALPDAFIGGGKSVNASAVVTFTDNGDASDDYASLWTSHDADWGSGDIGFRLGFDLDFALLGTEEIVRAAGWELSPASGVVLLTAHWQNAAANAALVVVTPDGTLIPEAAFDAHNGIFLADDLNGPLQRTVALHAPAGGIWDLQVVEGGAPLGAVTYAANRFVDAPKIVSLDVFGVLPTAEVDIDVTLDMVVDGLAIDLFAHDTTSGVRMFVKSLATTGGITDYQTTWDLADYPDGTFLIEAQTRHPDHAPHAVTDDTQIILAPRTTLAVLTDGDGAALAGTLVALQTQGGEIVVETRASGQAVFRHDGSTGGFGLASSAPPAGDDIRVTDALNVLRIAIGLDPLDGAADGFDFVSADVDENGTVTVMDALDVLRHAVGLDTVSDVGASRLVPTAVRDADMTRDAVAYETGFDLTMDGILLSLTLLTLGDI